MCFIGSFMTLRIFDNMSFKTTFQILNKYIAKFV